MFAAVLVAPAIVALTRRTLALNFWYTIPCFEGFLDDLKQILYVQVSTTYAHPYMPYAVHMAIYGHMLANLCYKLAVLFGEHTLIISNFNHKCTFRTFAEKTKTRKKKLETSKNLRGARKRAAAARRCNSLCQDARPQRKPANMGPWSL